MVAKSPDRLNISKKSKIIVDKIEKNKFLNLDTTHTSRSFLFSYAMALGLDTFPTKVESVYPGGLVLDSSIDSRTKALMYSYIISKSKDKESLDEITNKEYVYRCAQEYANTGFQIIENYVDDLSEEEIVWKLFDEMDDEYKVIMCNDLKYSSNKETIQLVAEKL